MKLFLFLVVLFAPDAFLLAQAAGGPQEEKQESNRGVRFVFRRRPSLRFGDVLRIDFRAKVQNDFRGFSPEIESDEGLHDLNRARIGVEGRFLKDFEYEVEYELRRTDRPWRDAFVNYRRLRFLQFQVGKFKLPFSMEQLTGPTNLDFIFRSRIANRLAPARDRGIMLHGRFFERGLRYQAGVFLGDGENSLTVEDQTSGKRTFAGRVTGTPLRLIPAPDALKSLEIGGAFTSSNLPERLDPNSTRGRAADEYTFFPRIYSQGQRLRLGTELRWMPGPFSLKGEFVHARDQRLGQGLRSDDLPDMISRGWYLSGSWVVTGEQKGEGVDPRKEFLFGGGIGAVELAARYESLRFGSSEHPGRASRTPRAANILGNSDRAWTLGVNWYVNRWVKIQGNAIRERFEDVQRTPVPGKTVFWMYLVRIQSVM